VIRYRYHPEAIVEYRAAATWYRQRSLDAARRLRDAVSAGLRSIRERPLAWPVWRGGPARRRVLQDVPYSLIFGVDDDEVVIFAVAHHSRDPDYWIHRMR
jgi:toxin ParE1/3/4